MMKKAKMGIKNLLFFLFLPRKLKNLQKTFILPPDFPIDKAGK